MPAPPRADQHRHRQVPCAHWLAASVHSRPLMSLGFECGTDVTPSFFPSNARARASKFLFLLEISIQIPVSSAPWSLESLMACQLYTAPGPWLLLCSHRPACLDVRLSSLGRYSYPWPSRSSADSTWLLPLHISILVYLNQRGFVNKLTVKQWGFRSIAT